jgi:S-adenosylmethionine/arginine decarboxylase-like enzyme
MLVHHLLVVNARVNNPPKDPQYITKWKANLIEDIGMKILMGPYSTYHDMPGNRGLTSVTIIETSHIALHVWDEDNPGVLRLDVYSCAEFNIDTILKAIEEFEPTEVDYVFLDRTGDTIGITV